MVSEGVRKCEENDTGSAGEACEAEMENEEG